MNGKQIAGTMMLALASACASTQNRDAPPGHNMNEHNELDPRMRDQMERERRRQSGSNARSSTLAGGAAHEMNESNELDPKMRAMMINDWRNRAGSDGQVSKEAFMRGMEGHWHALVTKHGHAGKVKPEDMPRIMMFLSGQDTAP